MAFAHGFGVDSQDLPDFFVFHVFKVQHGDQFSFTGRKLFEQLVDFESFGLFENRIFILIRGFVGGSQFFGVQGLMIADACLAIFIDQRISGNIRKPGTYRGYGRIIAVITAHRFDENITDHILGPLLVQQLAVDEIIYVRKLLFIHFFEGFFFCNHIIFPQIVIKRVCHDHHAVVSEEDGGCSESIGLLYFITKSV